MDASVLLKFISDINKWCSLHSLCGLSFLWHLLAGTVIRVETLHSPRCCCDLDFLGAMFFQNTALCGRHSATLGGGWTAPAPTVRAPAAPSSRPQRGCQGGIPGLLSVHLHASSAPIIFTALSMLNMQKHQGFLNAAINKTVIKLSV